MASVEYTAEKIGTTKIIIRKSLKKVGDPPKISI
jgi:hypothetical protein